MARPVKETGKRVPGFTDAFGDRLQHVISRIGTLDQASAAAGASVDQLTFWKFGRSRPDFFALTRLCKAANISIDWLASDDGQRDSHSAIGDDAPGVDDRGVNILHVQDTKTLAGQAMVMLPRLDVEAAAGAGAVVVSEQIAEMVAFSAAWLRERHITPRTARILTARGDSMEPTIRDGDMLIVDTAIEMAVDNGIYCVAYNGVLLVKRLFVTRPGGLVISSDNKLAGRDEEIPPHEVPDVHIAGRVMWYGRTI